MVLCKDKVEIGNSRQAGAPHMDYKISISS